MLNFLNRCVNINITELQENVLRVVHYFSVTKIPLSQSQKFFCHRVCFANVVGSHGFQEQHLKASLPVKVGGECCQRDCHRVSLERQRAVGAPLVWITRTWKLTGWWGQAVNVGIHGRWKKVVCFEYLLCARSGPRCNGWDNLPHTVFCTFSVLESTSAS